MRAITAFLLAILLVISTSSPVFAQDKQTDQEKKAAKVKDKLQHMGTGKDAKVKAKTYSGLTYEGTVTRAGDSDFDVTDKSGASHTVKYSEVKSIGGKNLSTGAKIGIGIGIGAGATIAILFMIVAAMDD